MEKQKGKRMYLETIGVLERAFKLLEIICKEKEFTTRLIAEKLNCSERTARRYVEKIRYIFGDKIERKSGFKYVWKGFPEIEKTLIESPNLKLFYAFIELGKKVGDDKKFWKEIEKVFTSSKDNIVKILMRNVINFEKIKGNRIKIEDGIERSKLIKFKYLKSGKFYEVEPYKVILADGFWYLLSIDTKDEILKTFALDLMEKIEIVEDSSFERIRKQQKLKNLLEKAENIIQLSVEPQIEEIIIEVYPEISRYFERKTILTGQEIFDKTKEGRLKIKFYVRNEEDFKLQMFQWIPYFKIIKPEKYKKYLKEQLKKALSLLL